MTTLSVPNTLTPGTPEDISDVEDNFTAIETWANGNIDATNLAANAVTTAKITNANVTDAKLASPNNSAYKTLVTAANVMSDGGVAATYAFAPGYGFVTSATNVAGTDIQIPLLYLDDADYTVGSLSTMLRVRAQCLTNATASTITATVGFHAITACAGSADNFQLTLAAATSGSTVAFASQGASTRAQGNSGDFAFPADGYYCLGLVLSGSMPANSHHMFSAQLQVRHI